MKVRVSVQKVAAWMLWSGVAAGGIFIVLCLVTGDKAWLPWIGVASVVIAASIMYFDITRSVQEHAEWKMQRAKELGLEPGDPRVGEAPMVDPIDWPKKFGRKRKHQ